MDGVIKNSEESMEDGDQWHYWLKINGYFTASFFLIQICTPDSAKWIKLPWLLLPNFLTIKSMIPSKGGEALPKIYLIKPVCGCNQRDSCDIFLADGYMGKKADISEARLLLIFTGRGLKYKKGRRGK